MVWFNNTLKNDPIRCKKLASDGVIFQSVIKPYILIYLIFKNYLKNAE